MFKRILFYSLVFGTLKVLGVVEENQPTPKDPEEIEKVEIEEIRKRYCKFMRYKGNICADLREEIRLKTKKRSFDSMDAGLGIEPNKHRL